MWQVWPLPSRCLLSSLLSLSPCISLSTRTLSLALISSNNAASLFFFFFLGISLSLSFLLSLTFTLLRSISPSVSLHLHVVPALMQLLITNPLIFEVWLSLIWRTARGWGNKERHEQLGQVVRGEEQSLSGLLKSQDTCDTRLLAASAATDWNLITPSYTVYTNVSLLSQSVPLLQCMCKNAKERTSELLSALTYSECGNTQSPTQRVSEVSKMPSDNGLLYLSCNVWLPTTKASSILKASAWLYVLKRTRKSNLRLCFEFFSS